MFITCKHRNNIIKSISVCVCILGLILEINVCYCDELNDVDTAARLKIDYYGYFLSTLKLVHVVSFQEKTQTKRFHKIVFVCCHVPVSIVSAGLHHQQGADRLHAAQQR